MRGAIVAIMSLVFLWGGAARGRSLDLFESYSLAAHGGLEDRRFYNAGLQAMTLTGPGDSGWIMGHLGFGLDVGYAHDGDGVHHLRIVPTAEILFYWVYLQLGLGTFVDLEHPDTWGFDLACNFGLRVFLGDEYQWPSVSAGGRLDYMLTKDGDEFVPSFMAMISFYFDE